MDIQKDIDVLYKEIDALQEEIVEEACMSPEEDDRLELLIAKATKFGELCAQRDAKSQAVPEWISVEDALPPYGKPVQVYCGNSSYKHEGLKQTVASYECAKELIETCEHLDEGDDVKDSWIAHSSLFDGEYGGRFLNEDVTHWRKLPESPVKAQEQRHD